MEKNTSIKKDIYLTVLSFVLFFCSFIPVFSQYSLWLCLASALISGYDTLIEGIKDILHLELEEEALMLIAVVSAFLIGEYREGAMVSLLFSAGEKLEDIAVDKSRDRIKALADIRPDKVHVISENDTYDVMAKDVKIQTKILVKVGERVPLDAKVLEKSVLANTSALTGESMPRLFNLGEVIGAGCVILASPAICETVSGYGDSAAARIIDMVQNAAEKKGKTEKFITKFSKIYTPLVISLAGILFLVAWLSNTLTLSDAAHRALVFLVSSCPCALVISVPLAYFAGIGTASKYGVLIKGSEYCDMLSNVKNAVFDKTGTLTTGIMKVGKIEVFGDTDERTILSLAASSEKYSDHPIAKCIVDEALKREIPITDADKVHEIAGQGITAVFKGNKVAIGNRKMFDSLGTLIPENLTANLYISKNGVFIGCIYLDDTVDDTTISALKSLNNLGISDLYILTGDNKESASKAAKLCNINNIHASLSPEDKLIAMEEIKKSGVTVYTGDGINDAPVLAAADIGAAIGMGTDAAVEAADIVLMKDGISSLPKAIDISKKIRRCAKEDIIFIMAVKVIVLILGALGYAPIWLAVFADVGVCFITLLWSLKLLGYVPKVKFYQD